MKRSRVTLINVVTNLILQVCIILSGFIIPKIILSYFGSNVNGLVSSLNQFLNYINLLEGGLTGVISASLYKPLCDKNYEKINSIIRTSTNFYQKIGLIFIVYSILLAIIYPVIFNTGFSYLYVFSLTIILAISLFIQYMFSFTLRILLTADKKVYVVAITQTIIIVLNIIFAVISVKVYPSVHVLKFITGFLFILQPIIFTHYVKKHYQYDKNAPIDKSVLKNRWNGFAINIAYFIHSSTDVTILTAFTNLVTVSVYGVYALVVNGIKQIITSICGGIDPTIGHAYAKGNNSETLEKLNIYEFITIFLVFFFFTVAGLLITPFVMIYTSKITDANYYQPVFGILLLLSEALYIIKKPHVTLAYSANRFKEITIPCFIEATLNIVISIILVPKYGLIGVAIGTIVAMLYRTVFHIHYTKKIIIEYKITNFYKKILLFTFATVLGVIAIYMMIPAVKYDVFNWIWHGAVYSIIMLVIYICISILFYKKEIKYMKKYLFKK